MSPGSSPAPQKRSMDDIEADIMRTREELSETLGVLADKVNPRLQAIRAVERAKVKAAVLTGRARSVVRSVTSSGAGVVGGRKPTTIALVVAAAGLAAGAVVLVAKHRH